MPHRQCCTDPARGSRGHERDVFSGPGSQGSTAACLAYQQPEAFKHRGGTQPVLPDHKSSLSPARAGPIYMTWKHTSHLLRKTLKNTVIAWFNIHRYFDSKRDLLRESYAEKQTSAGGLCLSPRLITPLLIQDLALPPLPLEVPTVTLNVWAGRPHRAAM